MSGNLKIPQSYIISKFFSYAGKPTQSRNYLNGSCPICKEGGGSWLKKKRLFYFPNDEYLYCHNCVQSWTPYHWVKLLSGMSFKEIMQDIKEYTGHDVTFEQISLDSKPDEKVFELPALPGECVNLMDEVQVKYYENYYVVKIAMDYCKKRRLFTAINHPKAIYVCVHRNRLIIPYYDDLGKIIHYISRQLLNSDDKAKYLLKFNSGKPIFNLNKIDENFPYIFIFEGPIDAMFVKNGVAISGVSMTEDQESTLNSLFPFHKRIWVFDNFRQESNEVREKIKTKLKDEMVFLYEGDFNIFKDLNDYCVRKNLDLVNPDLIIKGSYRGFEGLLKLTN